MIRPAPLSYLRRSGHRKSRYASLKHHREGGLSASTNSKPFDSRQSCPTSMRLARYVAISKGMSRLNQGRAVTVSAARIRRWFEKVRDAWDDFQASRARDAVYGYLEAVFAIVEHYKVRRRTTRLRRHAFRFALFRLTTVQIHLLRSFAARVTRMSAARRSANGPERCGMSLVARCRRRG